VVSEVLLVVRIVGGVLVAVLLPIVLPFLLLLQLPTLLGNVISVVEIALLAPGALLPVSFFPISI